MDAQLQTIDPGERDEPVDTVVRQMLLAMQCLDHQINVLKAKRQQASKSWADLLKDDTQSLNGLIREPVPDAARCEGRLVDIQGLDAEKQKHIAARDEELEGLKQQIAENEAAFFEILRRRTQPDQLNMNFGAPKGFDPAAGLILPAVHLEQVRAAAHSFQSEHDETVDGMPELFSRLDELGVMGLEFPAEPDDENDGDDGQKQTDRTPSASA